MAFWDKAFCKHQWRIEDKNVSRPPWDSFSEEEKKTVTPEPWMFAQVTTATYFCTKCPEIKKVVSSSEVERS